MATMFKALDHKGRTRIQEWGMGNAGTEATVGITAMATKVADDSLVVTPLAKMEDGQIKTLSHNQ